MLLSQIAAQEQAGGGSVWTLLLPLVLLVGLWFVMIRPQRKRQKQMAEMQRSVQPGQRVMTGAGLIGTVSTVEGDEVVLEIAPGVETRFVKQAIARSLDSTASEAGTESGGDSASTDTERAADAGSESLPVTHNEGRNKDN